MLLPESRTRKACSLLRSTACKQSSQGRWMTITKGHKIAWITSSNKICQSLPCLRSRSKPNLNYLPSILANHSLRKSNQNNYPILSFLQLLTSRTSSRHLYRTTHHQLSSICCSEGAEMAGRVKTFTLSVTKRTLLSLSSNQAWGRSVEDSLVSHGLVVMVGGAVTLLRICSQ